MYIYICANESISDLISDGTVTYKKAVDKFKENVDNHNINRPIVIVPLDINFAVSEEERVNQIQDYEKLKDKVDEYNDIIDDLCELNKDLKKVDADIKKIKGQIKYREKKARKLDSEIKSEGVVINNEANDE